MIATHDVEFAATFADRVILLARGEVAADGTARELLSGGWYFSSEVARILDGAAVTVEDGVSALGAELDPRPGGAAAPAAGRDRMSWEAGVMAMLGLTLLGGFAWYERSRPPSQIVALVAALAAISVAGRVAFSPIPNVVPTTDITLIAGFALGPAPGFAVGALSGLVSNFWLGQGPWTPWQMAGWGLTGILGAAVALASGRRIGRFRLALICAFAGFAYGALLDFSLMVTYGGEQSLSRFLALSARGLPFNIAHAAGNAALALVAGPAMIRMLLRYRHRFEFAWRTRWVARARAHAGSPRGPPVSSGALLIASPVLAGRRPGERLRAAAPGPRSPGCGPPRTATAGSASPMARSPARR